MAINRRAALQAAAALAAASAAVSGGADATPVTPTPEEVTAPPAIVEEMKTPDAQANDLYAQVDNAYNEMAKGETPTIVVDKPVIDAVEVKGNPVAPQEPEAPVKGEEVKKPVAADADEAETTTAPVVSAEEKKAETKPVASAPATGNVVITAKPTTGRHAAILAAQAAQGQGKADADVSAEEVKPSAGASQSVADPVAPNKAPEAPKTPVVEETKKDLSDKNWGSDEQNAAVQAFLDEHPTGSVWNDYNTYRSTSGCAAYAWQLHDVAIGGQTKTVESLTDKTQLRQYDVVTLRDGHAIFVLEILEDGTFRCAEGNFNGKTYNEGICHIDDVVYIFRAKTVK